MSNKRCAHCGSNDIEEIEYYETLAIRGQTVSYHGQSYKCDGCGDEYDTAESMDRNLSIIKDKLKIQELEIQKGKLRNHERVMDAFWTNLLSVPIGEDLLISLMNKARKGVEEQ